MENTYLDKTKKISYVVNAALMLYVFSLTFIYQYYHVKHMVLISIPILGFYIFYFFLIFKSKLALYLWMVYGTILFYMCNAAICLGTKYGFHLYCMSLIPIIYYTVYLSKRIKSPTPNANLISFIIVVCYVICTVYPNIKGPLYTIDDTVATTFFIINSISVFFFITGYSSNLIKIMASYEITLENMAHKDKLTGVYNRHFILDYIEKNIVNYNKNTWIAILDIDHFKNVNDTYGHFFGDYTLKHIAQLLQEVCTDCIITRWGGEEFLILPKNNDTDISIIEKFRATVEKSDFTYENTTINVTVTLGTAFYENNHNIDAWIKKADEKLYYGKEHGRNQVVM